MTDEKRRIPIWEGPAAASTDEAAGRADGAPPPGPDSAAAVSPEGGPGSESASDAAARSPASTARPSWPQTVEGGGTEGDEDVGGTDAADDVPLATEDALEALAAERDMFYDQLLRQRAEFENFRRRTQKELSDAEGRARGRLLGEFLPILDNLDRALSAAEHHEEGKVLQGVRMTHTLFEDLLRREGVTAIDPVGEPFDPAVHEAMVFAPSEEPEGVVTATLERGYVVGDRLLRPARVAVSAGADGGPVA